MKKVIRILNRLITVLLVLAVAFAGYVFVSVFRAGKDRVPSVFGFSFLHVVTGSMEPTIPTGSLIIVRNTTAENVKIGDVICFYSIDPSIENIPNTHRVTAIQQGDDGDYYFMTKGDASDREDPYPVPGDKLVGVYLRSFSIGRLYEIIHSQYFFFFALLLPLFFVIFVEMLHVKKAAMEREEEKNAHDA